MPSLSIYVTDDTLARLKQEARDRERTVEDLAECAIDEAVRCTELRDEPDAKASS